MLVTLVEFSDFLESKGVLKEYKEQIRIQNGPNTTMETVWNKYRHSEIIDVSLDWSQTSSKFAWPVIHREWYHYVSKNDNNNSKKLVVTGYRSIW